MRSAVGQYKITQRHVAFSSYYRIILPTFAVIYIYSPLSGINKAFIYSFFVFFYQ